MSLLHQVALTFIPGIGAITARVLVNYCGSAEAVFKTPQSKLLKIPGIGRKTIMHLNDGQHFTRAEKEILFTENNNSSILFFTDPAFPKRLQNCSDAPVLLYYKGTSNLNHSKIVNIVGSRKATDYGLQLCQKLIEHLKDHQVLVISGLAYGIDICVHKECLKHNLSTIGVLGHGMHCIYPAQHSTVAEKMLAHGGLLTEFPSGTAPTKENFPKRNRIIAGIADATIVVESSMKGGALITAAIANSYNRDVFAFPGRVGDTLSEGCNELIRQNMALLITGATDLIYFLGWALPESKKKPPPQLSLPINVTPEERIILDSLQQTGSLSIDELLVASKLPLNTLALKLLDLEMQGYVRSLPGKIYSLSWSTQDHHTR